MTRLTIGTSLIPPKDRLMREIKWHAAEYDHLNSKAHMDDWLSQGESDEFHWHGDEVMKLKAVLDALYPGWDDKPGQGHSKQPALDIPASYPPTRGRLFKEE